jgi:putative tricarboxylic transport membrane protein
MLSAIQEESGVLPEGKIGKLMPNREELRAGLGAGARSTILAFPMGLFPGMVPSIITFLCYSFERQRSKTPERFGKGAIEGVASAEAANNAAAMGNLVPLLSLGVPTGPTMALMLAALTMYGLILGPLLFSQYANFTWTVIGSFFVANCILLVLNLPLVGLWARIVTVPYPILAPVILAICLIGTFSIRTSLFDVYLMILFGLLGWAMRKRQWPAAPMVLGFVLGPMIEHSLRQVIAISPGLIFQRPVFWGFIVAGIVVARFSRKL